MSVPRAWLPDEFVVPDDLTEVPATIGDIVKVVVGKEAPWVRVTGVDGPFLLGEWNTLPVTVDADAQDRLKFRRVSVIRVWQVSP